MCDNTISIFFNSAEFKIEKDGCGRRVVIPKNSRQLHDLSEIQREAWELFRKIDNNLVFDVKNMALDNPTVEEYRIRIATIFHNYNQFINKIHVDDFLYALDSIDDYHHSEIHWGYWTKLFAKIIGETLPDKPGFIANYKQNGIINHEVQ